MFSDKDTCQSEKSACVLLKQGHRTLVIPDMYLPSGTVFVNMLINILDLCCLERPEPCEKSMLIIPPNAAAEAIRELGGEKNIKSPK